MELLTGIFTAFGLSASAGLNAYIPLLVVGLIGHYFPDLMKLNQPWDTLANPWIVLLLCVLVIIEMLADKVPAVNHINDLIQTFIRPAAGAIVFAASANVVSDIHPVLALAAGLLISGTVHLTKSGVVRPVVTRDRKCTGQHRRGCHFHCVVDRFSSYPNSHRHTAGGHCILHRLAHLGEDEPGNKLI